MKQLLTILLSALFATTALAQGQFKADGNFLVSFYQSTVINDREAVPFEDFDRQTENIISEETSASIVSTRPGLHFSFEPYLLSWLKVGLGFGRQSITKAYDYDVQTKAGPDTIQQAFRYRETYTLNQYMLRGIATKSFNRLVVQGGLQLNFNDWSFYSEMPDAAQEGRKLDDSPGISFLGAIGFSASKSTDLIYEYAFGELSSHKVGIRFRIF